MTKAKTYTLHTGEGMWLGQVVITEDGFYGSVTDWGNFSYTWRHFGGDFREFICRLNPEYFADKMATGMAYIHHSRKCDTACRRYADKILPALQEILRKELENNEPF